MFKLIFTSLILLCSGVVFGQLVTSGNLGPTQLVENILVGQGVTVTNVNYNGSAGAIGSFTANNTSLGIEEGIILTTGTINSGPAGPYGPNNRPDAGLDNNAGGFAPLTNIVGTNTYNAAILEFDFVPQSDTVRFEYIFGSDEYPEWVGEQFNDVFAFFISGPGIPGGQQNMAIIPGTTQPVTINDVNNGNANNGPCSNCQFYNNNGTGNNAPFNNDPFYIQYDGFTTPLEAVSPVECGETYHLIIAVADVADAIYDSGIFLAAQSLSSEQPVNVAYELSSDPYGDGQTMAQGCTSTTVTVTRGGNNINNPLTVPISLGGSAVEGVDYSNIPDEINFDAGETEATFTFDALPGGQFTGSASIVLDFEIFDPCGNNEFQTIELFINEVEDVEVALESGEIACPGDDIEIIASPSGGGGGYEYLWNTGDTTSSIFITPDETEEYTVEVTDFCLEQTAENSITIEVPDFNPIILDLTDDITEQCPFVPFDLTAEASEGAGGFIYEWTDSNGDIVSNQPLLTVIPSETTTYFVTVTDQCGESVSDEVTITILSPPLELTTSPTVETCPGDSVDISVTPSGGFGNYYYVWPLTGDTTATITVAPNETTTYKVIVRDDCQTFQVRGEVTVIVNAPDAQFQVVTDPLFVDFPITFQNLTNNGISYEWLFGDGNSSAQVHPNNTYSPPGEYEVTLIATDVNGCTDTIRKTLTILDEHFLYVPNAFTPNTSEHNPTFKVSAINIESFEILIFNRWGELLFESQNVNFEWDGSYNNKIVRDGVYPWKIKYKSVNDDEEVELNGFVTVIK